MPDPNTQIDWWIAQTWQEAQGGADTDALVAWLHENGLTAASSYTILQAALNCAPEDAKEMVFGNPVWADEPPDAELANLGYTSETLEPEPEPDPAFELDNWADEVEEDQPVYGEDGYKVDSAAGAAPPPMKRPDLDGFGNDGDDAMAQEPTVAMDPEPFAAEDDAEPQISMPSAVSAIDADDEEIPYVGMESLESEPVATEPKLTAEDAFEPEYGGDGDAGSGLPQTDFDDAPGISAFDGAEEHGTETPAIPPASPTYDSASSETAADISQANPSEPAPEPYQAPAPAPMPQPKPASASPPPILRMPPATPAERAAVFAGAFGKKPASSQTATAPRNTAATSPQYAEPPASETGPAAQADTAPAPIEAAQPQTDDATVAMPPPLVYEPLPEIEIPQPVAPAEPLFSVPAREPRPAPPLFPPNDRAVVADDVPATAAQPDDGAPADRDFAAELPEENSALAPESENPLAELPHESATDEPVVGESEAPERSDEPVDEGAADLDDPADWSDAADLDALDPVEPEDDGEPEPELAEAEQSYLDDTAEQGEDEPLGGDAENAFDDDDLPPGIKAALRESANREPITDTPSDMDGDDFSSEDDGSGEAAPEHSEQAAEADPDSESADRQNRTAQKRVLLDPDVDDAASPPDNADSAEAPAVGEDEDMAEAARNLGIDFRGADPDVVGANPEMTKAARELGISFRDDTTDEVELDETALAAQKLGISFREDGVSGGTPAKPTIVKYLPMIFGVFIVIILMLLGATYAGPFIGWMKGS